ncbi:MAG: hypothetical protein HGA33_01020 [Candidatus Moranbacteria bacterium]|nr:hypothetical protein [Candidatus Moranbacteria bacterium]
MDMERMAQDGFLLSEAGEEARRNLPIGATEEGSLSRAVNELMRKDVRDLGSVDLAALDLLRALDGELPSNRSISESESQIADQSFGEADFFESGYEKRVWDDMEQLKWEIVKFQNGLSAGVSPSADDVATLRGMIDRILNLSEKAKRRRIFSDSLSACSKIVQDGSGRYNHVALRTALAGILRGLGKQISTETGAPEDADGKSVEECIRENLSVIVREANAGGSDAENRIESAARSALRASYALFSREIRGNAD